MSSHPLFNIKFVYYRRQAILHGYRTTRPVKRQGEQTDLSYFNPGSKSFAAEVSNC